MEPINARLFRATVAPLASWSFGQLQQLNATGEPNVTKGQLQPQQLTAKVKQRRTSEGPQLRLQLCIWLEKTSVALGGGATLGKHCR